MKPPTANPFCVGYWTMLLYRTTRSTSVAVTHLNCPQLRSLSLLLFISILQLLLLQQQRFVQPVISFVILTSTTTKYYHSTTGSIPSSNSTTPRKTTTILYPIMMNTPSAAASSSSSTNVNSNSQEGMMMMMMTHEERLQLYLLEQNILELPPAPKAAANYCPCQRSGDLLYLSGHLPFSSIIILDENNNSSTTTTLEPYTGRLGGASSSSMDNDNYSNVVIMEQDDVTMGYNAAKQAGLNIIATIRNELGGSINNVDQIIKLFGLVQSHDTFHQQHLVMNGCSDVMTHVFGPITGKHARSAVGTNALPLNSMIEIEAIVRLKPTSSLPPSSL